MASARPLPLPLLPLLLLCAGGALAQWDVMHAWRTGARPPGLSGRRPGRDQAAAHRGLCVAWHCWRARVGPRALAWGAGAGMLGGGGASPGGPGTWLRRMGMPSLPRGSMAAPGP